METPSKKSFERWVRYLNHTATLTFTNQDPINENDFDMSKNIFTSISFREQKIQTFFV